MSYYLSLKSILLTNDEGKREVTPSFISTPEYTVLSLKMQRTIKFPSVSSIFDILSYLFIVVQYLFDKISVYKLQY